MYNKNITEEEAKIYYGNKLFEYTIYNRWGLLYPYAKRTDIKNYYKTIQGINYRYAKPNDYATAWTIDNVYLSDKFYKYKASRYIHENQYKTTLVFVAGPNNYNPVTNREFNSIFRTYNEETYKHFHLFMNGVEAALFAGLIAMVYSECNVALLVNVSGGLYRGTHDKEDYKHAYINSLDNGVVAVFNVKNCFMPIQIILCDRLPIEMLHAFHGSLSKASYTRGYYWDYLTNPTDYELDTSVEFDISKQFKVHLVRKTDDPKYIAKVKAKYPNFTTVYES